VELHISNSASYEYFTNVLKIFLPTLVNQLNFWALAQVKVNSISQFE